MTFVGIVLEARFALAQAPIDHQVQQDPPIALGCTGGNAGDRFMRMCCGGTLGCLVKHRPGEGPTLPYKYILGNNHVLAMRNLGHVGDGILHPGLLDSNCLILPDSGVATLSDYVPLLLDVAAWNFVDAAIAQIIPGKVDEGNVILEMPPVCKNIVEPYLTMPVRKSGRTTGLTHGTVAAVSTWLIVYYPTICGNGPFKKGYFLDQIAVNGDPQEPAFCEPGDSGSILFDHLGDSNVHAVGLLFAGGGYLGYANRIQRVLDSFNVEVVGANCLRGHSPNAPYTAEQLGAVKAVQAKWSDRLFRRANVQGHGIELGPDGELRIVVYIERMFGRFDGPVYRDGVEFRPQETGRIYALGCAE